MMIQAVKNELGQVAELLNNSTRVIISGHMLPDGDSLGSSLALGLALEMAGKEVLVVSPDPPPDVYKFLPGIERVALEPNQGPFDTFVAVDCSVPDRLGRFKSLMETTAVVVNIDHHTGTVPFGTCNYVDARAAATGEILVDLLELMQVPISLEIATCLYVALVTDTGSFKYEQTSANTHRRVARLMDLGVPAAKLNIYLYDEKPLVAVRILQAALESLKISDCGQVAWITIERNVLDNLGADDQHTEGLINYAREIQGVEVALMFREIAPQQFKVSFRSKGEVDVNDLARNFGGGGHPRASGCVITGSLMEAVGLIVGAAQAVAGRAGTPCQPGIDAL